MAPARTAVQEQPDTSALTEALLARTRRAISSVTADVDERTAAAAVSAASDALVLVRLLEQPEVLETLRAADPLAPARLRGIAARTKLVELAGGLASSEEASTLLGLTRQAIEKRRRAGRLLAVSLGKRGYRYPMCQFHNGQSLPGLERVLESLESQDPWTSLAFLVNRRADLGGRSPVQLLRAGTTDAVVDAAETLSEQSAS